MAWGDFYFGHSLASALERRGHKVLICYSLSVKQSKWLGLRAVHRIIEAWNCFWFGPDIDFALRGPRSFPVNRRRANIMWMISGSKSVVDEEVQIYDHVFVASSSHVEQLKSRGMPHVSVLLQCTDASRFYPRAVDPALACECLFVGNMRKFRRVSVEYALQMGLQLKVWGRNWDGIVPSPAYAGPVVDNTRLANHYSSARIVLNDHAPDMVQDGFTSNRIFDALACGVPVLSDICMDLPDELAREVYVFSDYESFKQAAITAIAEDDVRKRQRLSAAAIIAAQHSFDARVEEIERVAVGLLKRAQN